MILFSLLSVTFATIAQETPRQGQALGEASASELLEISDELRRNGAAHESVSIAYLAVAAAPADCTARAMLALALASAGEVEDAAARMSEALELADDSRLGVLERVAEAVRGNEPDQKRLELLAERDRLDESQFHRRAELGTRAWLLASDPEMHLDLALAAADDWMAAGSPADAARVLLAASHWALADEASEIERRRVDWREEFQLCSERASAEAEALHRQGNSAREAEAWGSVAAVRSHEFLPYLRAARAHAASGDACAAVGDLKRALGRGRPPVNDVVGAWEFADLRVDPALRAVVEGAYGHDGLARLDELHARRREAVLQTSLGRMERRVRRRSDLIESLRSVMSLLTVDPGDAEAMLVAAELMVVLEAHGEAAFLLSLAVRRATLAPAELACRRWMPVLHSAPLQRAVVEAAGDEALLELKGQVMPEVQGLVTPGSTGAPYVDPRSGLEFVLILPEHPGGQRFLASTREVDRSAWSDLTLEDRSIVVDVSRGAAEEWCRVRGYALPTSAEWTMILSVAGAAAAGRSPAAAIGRTETSALSPASLAPALYGFKGLIGNAAEWCSDGPTEGRAWVAGGSWRDREVSADPAIQSSFPVTKSAAWIGFRPIIRMD